MRGIIENCKVIKRALANEVANRPETEELDGKVYCQGYEGGDGDPYEKCKSCKASIYSLEVPDAD